MTIYVAGKITGLSKEEIDALEEKISDKIISGDYELNYEPCYEEPDE